MIKALKNGLFVLFCLALNFTTQAQTDTTQQIVAARFNSKVQEQKPYVILISADGFRYDYAQKYGAKNLLELASGGVQAAAMYPSFPSLTFPNHYTLATGLYPSHSGMVANYFYDRNRREVFNKKNNNNVRDGSWYGGTPLWVLAEQQQMLSASFCWAGSEADIQKTLPTYYYYYNEQISIEDRINTVKNWLSLPEDKRPHLITFYFPEVDHAGHTFGPEAKESEAAVHWLDGQVAKLVAAVNTIGLPVNFIFVSDHGMTAVDRKNPLRFPADIYKEKFYIVSSGNMVNLYAKNAESIRPAYKKLKAAAGDYEVYLSKNVPARLHYGAKDDRFNRIGDIVLLAKWPKVFADKEPEIGAHGFDPYEVKDMMATFYAWGPAFKSNLRIPAFANVEVYDIVTQILGLSKKQPADGTGKIARKVLKK